MCACCYRFVFNAFSTMHVSGILFALLRILCWGFQRMALSTSAATEVVRVTTAFKASKDCMDHTWLSWHTRLAHLHVDPLSSQNPWFTKLVSPPTAGLTAMTTTGVGADKQLSGDHVRNRRVLQFCGHWQMEQESAAVSRVSAQQTLLCHSGCHEQGQGCVPGPHGNDHNRDWCVTNTAVLVSEWVSISFVTACHSPAHVCLVSRLCIVCHWAKKDSLACA